MEDVFSAVPDEAAAAATAEIEISSGAAEDPAIAWPIPQSAANAIAPAR